MRFKLGFEEWEKANHKSEDLPIRDRKHGIGKHSEEENNLEHLRNLSPVWLEFVSNVVSHKVKNLIEKDEEGIGGCLTNPGKGSILP